jgi:SAM-dependent methyltransferase
MYDQDDYQLNYQKLTFEDKLRKYRMQYIIDYFGTIKSDKILEIGCGNDPIFLCYNDFEVMDILEPGNYFYEDTKSKIGNDERISITKGFIEELYSNLRNDYDVIVIGGFLHEIDNPEEVLAAVHCIMNPKTVVITYVPNANSFHRLLAFESGLIKSNYEFSENDKLFGRRNVFNLKSITSLFASSSYSVIKTDTYFIKPFTHEQMDSLLRVPLFSADILDGLFKMSKYMPDMGCEIFLAANTKKS